MASIKRRENDSVEIPISSMIDCVFLLLIYFLVSTTMKQEETDLHFQLPGTVSQDSSLNIPDETFIQVNEIGQIYVNDFAYDSPESLQYLELTSMLTRFQESSFSNKNKSIVTIAPHDSTPHQILVRIMDACSKAKIDSVNFALTPDSST